MAGEQIGSGFDVAPLGRVVGRKVQESRPGMPWGEIDDTPIGTEADLDASNVAAIIEAQKRLNTGAAMSGDGVLPPLPTGGEFGNDWFPESGRRGMISESGVVDEDKDKEEK